MKSSTAVFVEEFFAFQTRDVSVGFVAFLVAYVFFLFWKFLLLFFVAYLFTSLFDMTWCHLFSVICCRSSAVALKEVKSQP